MSDPRVDAAYSARATVSEAEFEEVMRRYRAESVAAVAGLDGTTDVAFDPSCNERLDVWGRGTGLRSTVIAVHGGYWRMLSRHDTAFMARVLADAGIATVVPDYTLSPEASLEEIVRQVRSVVTWVHREGAGHGLDADRIHLVGSSAGGHLAAMAAAGGWQEAAGLPADAVRGFLAISGLFDLRPLVDSFVNDWLDLTPDRAAALSPELAPVSRARAVVAVAAHEASGFHDQAATFHERWHTHSESTHLVIPDRHHFDVFLDLADASSILAQALVELAGRSD